MTKHELIKTLVLDGYAVEMGQLTICDIKKFYQHHLGSSQYQVHCEHSKAITKNKFPYSELFNSVDDAVRKFLSLKELIYGIS